MTRIRDLATGGIRYVGPYRLWLIWRLGKNDYEAHHWQDLRSVRASSVRRCMTLIREADARCR